MQFKSSADFTAKHTRELSRVESSRVSKRKTIKTLLALETLRWKKISKTLEASFEVIIELHNFQIPSHKSFLVTMSRARRIVGS